MNKKYIQMTKNSGNFDKKRMQNNSSQNLVKKEILGVEVTDAPEVEILEEVVNFIEKTQKSIYIVTPNPEMIVAAAKNTAFKNALNQADLALCDGMGLLVASKIMGKPLTHRIIGTNFVERLCEKAAKRPTVVGFLGGKPGVAVRAVECLQKKYPGLTVGFAGDTWTETKLDILFVAFGHPKQELWMSEHVGKIPVRVMMGVGGAFDQIVDPTLRAPIYINSIGMGWLYRLIREPWRIKRQLALLKFAGMVIQKRFS